MVRTPRVALCQLMNFSFDGTYYQEGWYSVKSEYDKHYATVDLDAQIAATQAYVAAQPDRALWDIVMDH